MTQSAHWIHPNRAIRRNVASHHCRDQQRTSNARVSEGIVRCDSNEHADQWLRDRERREQSNASAASDQQCALPDNQPENSSRLSAQSHPHAKLVTPTARCIRHNSINTHHRQQETESAECSSHRRTYLEQEETVRAFE